VNKGKQVVLVILIFAGVFWWALSPRKRMHHPMPPLPEHLDPAVLAEVGKSYDAQVKPIFQAACFDCHSTHTVWPWYHALPGVRQFLDGHVEDGRRALDLSNGFPFAPGAKGLMKLRGIVRNVGSGDMPLASYKLMHPDARLTDGQRQVIVTWAQDSFDRLTSTAKAAGDAGAGGRHGKGGHGGRHRHHQQGQEGGVS
jgi:hypothetical protein